MCTLSSYPSGGFETISTPWLYLKYLHKCINTEVQIKTRGSKEGQIYRSIHYRRQTKLTMYINQQKYFPNLKYIITPYSISSGSIPVPTKGGISRLCNKGRYQGSKGIKLNLQFRGGDILYIWKIWVAAPMYYTG